MLIIMKTLESLKSFEVTDLKEVKGGWVPTIPQSLTDFCENVTGPGSKAEGGECHQWDADIKNTDMVFGWQECEC
jgi:hypothetical protein